MLAAGLGTAAEMSGKSMSAIRNQDFYHDGKFLADKAKDTYFSMMRGFGYPISPRLKSELWVVDFSLGDFARVGMAGIFWYNDKATNVFGHEIFLLPGQMIVEHSHVETAKAKPKMESWHPRHGSVYCFGETGGDIPAGVVLPKSQEQFITVRKCTEVPTGDILTLNRVTAKHFMMGGPSGGIVSEYASFHDNDGLRFTNPGVKF